MTGFASGDWREDAGYNTLAAELGASFPTGAGVVVLQGEANTGSSPDLLYLPEAAAANPFAGTGVFAGKTFHADSGLGGASGHAAVVGSIFYGAWGSLAPGIPNVHCLLADDLFEALAAPSPPPTYAGRVQNHSWIGDTSGDPDIDDQVLRKYDLMLDRDGIVGCVPLNNGAGSTIPVFMSSCYNTLCAGLRSGDHSRGSTVADGVGRMKPDLVVDAAYTSHACPAVASAAAFLLDGIDPAYPGANHPQVIKALLLAGASKQHLPGWQRAGAAKPYDSVFGAGELNLLHPWHILASGQQTPAPDVERSPRGWDYGTTSTISPARYFLSVPKGQMAATFSVAVTWHRIVTEAESQVIASLPDLDLRLYASTAFAPLPQPLDQSLSVVDNVEHLFLRNLPAGQYLIEVTADTDGVAYGLAWEADLQLGPALHVTTVPAPAATTTVECQGLDPFTTYTIESSANLGQWDAVHSFRTADTAPSFNHTWSDPNASSLTPPRFYRLRWTAVR